MISPGTRTRSGLCTGREAGKETMSLRHPSWTPCSPRYSSMRYRSGAHFYPQHVHCAPRSRPEGSQTDVLASSCAHAHVSPRPPFSIPGLSHPPRSQCAKDTDIRIP
ncbi:hypothetical protein B0H19DRAFT_1192362 [Mycena capillaripes]|nr:hypothetical protein B0H19DRAFT_1192362 [Mycena capillaripes]